MWKRILKWVNAQSFRTILCMILILFTLVPLMVVHQSMVKLYEDHIIAGTCDSSMAIVEANNMALDALLGSVETVSESMMYNEDYYNTFSEIPEYTPSDYLRVNRMFERDFSKWFLALDEVYEAYLCTPEWIMGHYDKGIAGKVNHVKNAGWDEAAEAAGGLAEWITGYDYGETVQSEYLMAKEDYNYRYLFTLIRKMKFHYFDGSSVYTTLDIEEAPVLVIHIREQEIRKIYENTLTYEGSIYGIANEDGVIASSQSEHFPVTSSLPEEIFQYYGKSGTEFLEQEGERYLLCYDTLTDNGFFSFLIIPMDVIIRDTVTPIRTIQNTFNWILVVLSIVVAVLMSRYFFAPIQALMKASERVARGDFSANTPVPKQKEFKALTESFNHMETEISKLIYENYEIILQEKETQLMALAMQINPHFLYNTLNMINLTALKNGDLEASDLIMSLSEMLQYTARNQSEMGTLEDETAWLSNYLCIMSQRYSHTFQTEIDIDESLMSRRIPKLVLQPFVENAILHGFQNLDHKGILSIQIYQEEEYLCMIIRDNGKGMETGEIERFLDVVEEDGHIGIGNVRKRLHLLYGDYYELKFSSKPGEGTEVFIRIPVEKNHFDLSND